jgi:hypothetical protein
MAYAGNSPRDSHHQQLHPSAIGPSHSNAPHPVSGQWPQHPSRQGSIQQRHQEQQQHIGSASIRPAAAGRPGSSQSRPASVSQHAARAQYGSRAYTTAVPYRTDSLRGHAAAGPSLLPQEVYPHAAAPVHAPPAHSAAGICGTFSTPRGYNRGPRSYALALAEASRTSTAQHSQADRGQLSSRPNSAAMKPGARLPGQSGYLGFHSGSSSNYSRSNSSRSQGAAAGIYTPRRPETGSQQGVINDHYHYQQQQHGRVQAEACAAAPATQGRVIPTTSSSRSQQGCGIESSLQRPGSATSGSQRWPCEQLAGCRPHTVAAGSPLLLSECFRPSTAAGPASISGVEGHSCISRPHTAAAAVAGWWDAASAGLSSRLDEGGGAEAEAEAEAELQRQRQLQQLWCAVHEIDGRPATRNGVRSR